MNALKKSWFCMGLIALLAGLPCACSRLPANGPRPQSDRHSAAEDVIQQVRQKYAPDSRLAIFEVGIEQRGRELVLTGAVDRAEARLDTVQAMADAGVRVTDRIKVLPEESLGDQVWGIGCLSVASGRLQPEHKAEMGTQVLMGEVVRVWKRSSSVAYSWYLAQTADGYLSWLQNGTFVPCTREQVEAWNRGPLLIVTALEDCILEQPRPDAQPVSDVVLCDLVRRTGEEGGWYRVELPDQRAGFLLKSAAEDYAAWKQARRASAENVEGAARQFIGRPYLWGGNSPKGFDCSGFTKTVFFLNGIDLLRDSSKQAGQGMAIPLDAELSQLKKGDLLFFGRRPRRGEPERVVHVGIYLGDKLFIHSSGRVRIASLDPQSPLRDESRIRSLIRARRLFPND
ncbi:MAG TPA: C40 family peptidase [Candidatus Paceibacterota bacterium]|nr:C40 family peptidase [Candidatus Paceibacterota bacterium]